MSQDVTDGLLLLQEMWDEWQRDRTVTVTPGGFPQFSDPTAPLPVSVGLRAATNWNLAIRIRSAFGLEPSEPQEKMAARALASLQANNKQQVAPLHPGVPATPFQIIFLALRMAGRITDTQSVADNSADVDAAFSQLVMMLAQWSRERWLIFDEVDVFAPSTGALSYTIGPSCDFALPTRTDRIESAFVRLKPYSPPPVSIAGDFSSADFSGDDFLTDAPLPPPLAGNYVDYPLDVLDSREDYNLIGLKNLVSIPSCVFLDSGTPTGTVYIWPIPPAGQYEIHLSVKASLPVYGSLMDPLNVPAEYNEAMVTNLASRIMVLNGGSPSQALAGLARASLQTLRKANFQIGRLEMPSGLPGTTFGGFGGWGYGFGFGGYGTPADTTTLPSPIVVPTVPDGVLIDGLGNYLVDVNGNYLVAG